MRWIFRSTIVAMLLFGVIGAPGCLPGGGDDGGGHASTTPAPMWQDLLTDVSFADASVGLVSGWDGRLLRTTDGGANWVETHTGTNADLNSVAFLTDSVAIAVGSGGKILRSTDAGMSWQQLDSPTSETINKVVRAGSGLAVAAGWNGTILTSTDDGASWTLDRLDPPNNYISLDYREGVGMLVSSGGFVYRTFDGTKWEPVALPEQASPAAVSLYGQSEALLVGEFGEMLISNNAGTDWFESTSILTADLLCSTYVGNARNAIAAGWDGIMIRTGDGGTSWGAIAINTTRPIRAIEVVDPLTLYAVGDGDTIFISRDGGFTWAKQKSLD